MKRSQPIAAILTTGILTAGLPANAETKIALEDELRGNWTSITCELRPEPFGDGGSVSAFHLTRDFTYDGNLFEGSITAFADPLCQMPIVSYSFAGHLVSEGPSPAAKGAEKINYVLDRELTIMPELQEFADQLNQFPSGSCGANDWEVAGSQSILETGCPLFELAPGEVYTDYDIVHIIGDMLFFGAKPVDGSNFDVPENRPVQLQIPLIRVQR